MIGRERVEVEEYELREGMVCGDLEEPLVETLLPEAEPTRDVDGERTVRRGVFQEGMQCDGEERESPCVGIEEDLSDGCHGGHYTICAFAVAPLNLV